MWTDEKAIGAPTAVSVAEDFVVIVAEFNQLEPPGGTVTTIARYPLTQPPTAPPTWLAKFGEPCGVDYCPKLEVRSVVIDTDGHVFVGGQLHGSLMLGKERRGRIGDEQLVIMEFDDTGVVVRTILPRRPVPSIVMDLTVADDWYLHGVGMFESTLELDAGSVTSLGGTDVFALRVPR
jgi:hypothetical protein